MCSYNFLSAILTFLAKFHERWIMQTMDFSPEIDNIRKKNITTLNMDSRLTKNLLLESQCNVTKNVDTNTENIYCKYFGIVSTCLSRP